MSIKVSLQENKCFNKDFPKLMISANFTIVLFRTEEKGTVIESGESDLIIGQYCEYWLMECFKDYDGEVNLKNNNDIRRDNI
jgi:hypothetical protein